MVTVYITRESPQKGLCRRDVLTRLGTRILEGECADDLEVEVSVLLCDNTRIQCLNKTYRNKNTATDVLSFAQGAAPDTDIRLLGDIVISLEVVAKRNESRAAMRDDVRMLFCHGMLHLLGYDHATPEERCVMQEKQAHYLGVHKAAAWRTDS